jgi:hypothetical protein
MNERVERLPSKIVQYDDYNNVALCENGSVWEYFHMSKLWAQIHPPHEPQTNSSDLGEALAVLRMLAEYACIDHGKKQPQSLKAFDRAWETLKKHGA